MEFGLRWACDVEIASSTFGRYGLFAVLLSRDDPRHVVYMDVHLSSGSKTAVMFCG